jgi:hypothetical protein
MKKYLIYGCDGEEKTTLAEIQYADVVVMIRKKGDDVVLIVEKNRFGDRGKEIILNK